MAVRPGGMAMAGLTAALLAGCALAQAAPQDAGVAAASQRTAVAALRAHLFNSRTGKLSDDVLRGDVELGNVPAGPFASISTLVVVDLDFGREAPVPVGARVRLIAREAGKRVLLDGSARLGPVASDGKTHVAFWLSDTGCKPVELSATLVRAGGRVQDPARTATIAFACYE